MHYNKVRFESCSFCSFNLVLFTQKDWVITEKDKTLNHTPVIKPSVISNISEMDFSKKLIPKTMNRKKPKTTHFYQTSYLIRKTVS